MIIVHVSLLSFNSAHFKESQYTRLEMITIIVIKIIVKM